MVVVPPGAGPAIEASGAGTGGTPPAGQAWKVPLASAQPCRPVDSSVPRL
ncbi:hypothetical protein SFUMM280S_09319 [Streptomyces fumanus]